MGALDGFMAVWSKARNTFGEGVPQDGSQFDRSAQLRQLQSNVEGARPASQWTGSASESYDAANQKQGRVLAESAALDQRLRTEVDRAAAVVTAGRRDLDAVRQWVVSAASTVPDTRQGDRQLYTIVSKGSGDVADILQKSNGDLNAIAGRLRGLGGEYQLLGDGFKEGTGLDGQTDQKLTDEQKKRAQQDVDAALKGDKDAQQRVRNVLNTIGPDQLSGQVKLNPEQSSYLSQMQAQQKLRSVASLDEAAKKGAGDIMADSWQLMSNPKLEFPKTESVDGALEGSTTVKGGFDQLPDGVQKALGDVQARPGALAANLEDVDKITDIAASGNGHFKTDTDLDRGLMHKASDFMDTETWAKAGGVGGLALHNGMDDTVSKIFGTVSPDHQVVHDAITGHVDNPGNDKWRSEFAIDHHKFLDDVTHHDWADGGARAASLFDWTADATKGPEAHIAGETARSYADYLGHHRPDLMDLNGVVGVSGHHSLGEVNPLLVQGMAHGLAPYVNDIAGVSGSSPEFGHPLDNTPDVTSGRLPEAKAIFSILNTDPEAAKTINGAAYGQALLHDAAFAEDPTQSERPAQLHDSATLRALVDVGTHNAFETFEKNQANIKLDEYAWKSAAYDHGVTALSTAGALVPGTGGILAQPAIETLGDALKTDFIGQPPATPEGHPVPRLAPEDADHEMLNTLRALGHHIEGVPPEYYDPSGRIMTSEEMQNMGVDAGTYSEKVADAINQTLGFNFQDEAIKARYDDIINDPYAEPTAK